MIKFLPLIVFIFFVSVLDRHLLKANHGFSLHVIEAPIPPLSDENPNLSFPRELFDQTFHYLGRGAQSFVFESEDKSAVIKFYRFPSHMRRFPWTHHPLGYLFSSSRKNIKEYNLRRLELSFHSFFLSAEPLIKETGVLYVHLKPTDNLQQKVRLMDRLGYRYDLPLDSMAFVIQKRGISFFARLKEEMARGNQQECKHMIDGLIALIQSRSAHKITDLDNMEHDNYGWLSGQAIHLDIGRFQEKESINSLDEILRVTTPLEIYLSKTSPELHAYFQCSVNASSRMSTLDSTALGFK